MRSGRSASAPSRRRQSGRRIYSTHDNRKPAAVCLEGTLNQPTVAYVWVTETSDPFFHWQPVGEVAASGESVVVYSKNLVPLDFFRDNPRVALGLTITGWATPGWSRA